MLETGCYMDYGVLNSFSGIIKIKIYDISSFGNEEEVEQATIKFTAYYNNGKY